MELTVLRERLQAAGQAEVLRFFDGLDPAGKARLTSQIEALDLGQISTLVGEYVKQKPHIRLPSSLQPVSVYPRQPAPAQAALYRQALEHGEAMLRAGKVAAFLVAGGQGTRLGYEGPKGEYPVTPIKQKPLFQVFAEQLLAQERTFEAPCPVVCHDQRCQ